MLDSIRHLLSNILTTLILVIFYAAPIVSIVISAVYLHKLSSAKKRNKHDPGSVPEEVIKKLKVRYIISAVVATVIVAAFITIMILILSAIAYM